MLIVKLQLPQKGSLADDANLCKIAVVAKSSLAFFSNLGTMMPKKLFLACLFCLFWGLFVSACTPSGQLLSEKSSVPEREGGSSYETPMDGDAKSAPVAVLAEFKRPGFSFNLPDTSWGLVSDPNDENAPLEFFRAEDGRRAVIQFIVLEKGDDSQIMDRARMEMQSYETAGKKATYSEITPMELLGMTGVRWEVEGVRENAPYQACGFVAGVGNYVFFLSLTVSDSVKSRNELKAEWEHFFKGFVVDSRILQSTEKEISKERVLEHVSPSLGYRWKASDTLWHHWAGIALQNSDPDLVLSNKSEEAAFFVYGAIIDPEEVSSQDLFKVLLMRVGLDPQDPEMLVQRRRGGSMGSFSQDFEVIRTISGFDFHYVGRYFWDHGRGILVAGWAQEILYKKYRKILDRSVEGLTVEAVPEQTNDPKVQKFNAAVVSQVGLLRLEEKQPLVALSYFEKANRMDPNEPLYLINCGFVYQLKELYGPGVNHFMSQIDLVRKSGRLLSILGEMYESLFDYGQARKYAELALQYTPNNPEYVINLSDALWGLGQRTQSLLVVQRLFDKQPSARLGVYLAKTYMGMDQYAEAVDLLYGVRKRFGMNVDLGLTLMDALVFLGRYGEALAVSEETLPLGLDNYKVWLMRGKIQFYSKSFRNAERTLTQTLILRPDNEDAKSFLSATKAFLGKADNRTLQKPINPVEERPQNLKALLRKDFAAKAKAEEFPAVIHWQREALRATNGEAWVRTEQILMEILDVRGTAIYQEFTFDFLPGFDRIFVNALEVYDSTMTLKYKATLQNTYITYATELGGTNESQMAHFPLKELVPGDYIYLQMSRTSIENHDVIPYTDFISSRDIPVGISSFKIEADTSRFVTEEYGPLSISKVTKDSKEWQIENPVVIQKEMYMPVYRDFGAGLMLTGKQKWEDVGRNYQNLIQHQIKNAVAVREKAFEVRGNKMGDKAVLALVGWVRENIRYRDVRFGGHSLIPQTAEITLKEHQGDCKDQSLLLKEMLNAIGVSAQLVAIHLNETGFETLPTIQQFDHMMLYIPKGEKNSEMWVDPTDKAGNDRPVPLDMEGKVALIIDGENSRVAVTPILEDAEEHQVFLHHRLFIEENGSAEFRDSLYLQGKFASAFRNQLYGRDAKEQEKLMESFLSQGIPDVSISQVITTNVRDFNKPLILVVTFASPHYFGQSAQGIKGRFPNVWERSLMRLPKVRTRHHPIRMPHETFFTSVLEVSTVKNKKLTVQSNGDLGRDPEYTAYEKIPHGYKWTTFAIYADPSEYEKIREEWELLLQVTSPQIIVE